jgi:hypothetical protein
LDGLRRFVALLTSAAEIGSNNTKNNNNDDNNKNNNAEKIAINNYLTDQDVYH